MSDKEKKTIDIVTKRKEIYAFTVNKKEEVESEVKKKTEDGEEVTVKKNTLQDVPYRIVIKKPSKKQVEEAEMEYSIEISNCVKKGILTKAMLLKKYSDSGGLMSEEDSLKLTNLYTKYNDLQTEFQALTFSRRKSAKQKKRQKEIEHEFNETKRKIVDLEMAYSALFNHTADTKAQNRVITWYMLNLSYIYKEDEEEPEEEPLFPGETFEEKRESYYKMEEDEEDEFQQIIRQKLTTIVSFWFFSEKSEPSDFEKLEQDIDDGLI